MDQIPPEVLSNIFFQTLPTRDEIYYNAPLWKSVSSPLFISHVCRRWREITLNSGQLWSHLCIKYNAHDNSIDPELIVEIVETWLQRTSRSPLNFCLWYDLAIPWNKKTCTIGGYTLKILLSERHRWKDVDFRWFGIVLPLDLRSVELTNMPMLDSLSFRMRTSDPYSESSIDFTRIAHINIAGSPRLERLDLSGNYTLEVGKEPIYTLTGPGRLEYLSRFQLKSAIRLCLDFLRIAPNLRDLHVSRLIHPTEIESSSTHGEHILLRDLKTLQVDLRSSSTVLDSLTLHSLEELDIDCGSSNREEVLLRFVQRSLPPLRCLQLRSYGGLESDLISVLRLLPTLEVIFLAYSSVTNQLFQSLTLKSEESSSCADARPNADDECIICPRLCLFSVVVTRQEHARELADALYAMILSRWKYLKTFRRVRISDRVPIDIPLTPSEFGLLVNSLGSSSSKDIRVEGDDIHFPRKRRSIYA